MNYIPLAEFEKAWIFNRADLPVSEDDKAQIKLMSAERAATLWQTFISKNADHPDFFKKGDWPFCVDTWSEQGDWEAQWEGDELNLPDPIKAHLDWDSQTVVYYCLNKNRVIETRWEVFERCWKNFLFMDDGVLLIGKKRNQVVQFFSNGGYQLGIRP